MVETYIFREGAKKALGLGGAGNVTGKAYKDSIERYFFTFISQRMSFEMEVKGKEKAFIEFKKAPFNEMVYATNKAEGMEEFRAKCIADSFYDVTIVFESVDMDLICLSTNNLIAIRKEVERICDTGETESIPKRKISDIVNMVR